MAIQWIAQFSATHWLIQQHANEWGDVLAVGRFAAVQVGCCDVGGVCVCAEEDCYEAVQVIQPYTSVTVEVSSSLHGIAIPAGVGYSLGESSGGGP